MEPNKKIPSFCFESPWLKPFSFEMSSVEVTVVEGNWIRATWTPELAQDLEAYHNIDAEAELTALLSQQITEEIGRNIFYNYGPMEEPVVYDDGSWSMSNTFDGVIGIKSEIKQHTLI